MRYLLVLCLFLGAAACTPTTPPGEGETEATQSPPVAEGSEPAREREAVRADSLLPRRSADAMREIERVAEGSGIERIPLRDIALNPRASRTVPLGQGLGLREGSGMGLNVRRLGVGESRAVTERLRGGNARQQLLARRVLVRADDSLTACANPVREAGETVPERIEVNISVEPSGSVANVVVGTEGVAEELQTCVADGIRGLSFPTSEEAYEVHHRLRLE